MSTNASIEIKPVISYPRTAAAGKSYVIFGIAVLIPETYVPDLSLRMGLYKRAAALESEQDMEAFAAELPSAH